MSWGPLRRYRLPADLALVLALTLCVNVVTLVPLSVLAPVRVVVGVVFVVLVPGYVLTTAIFPHVYWDTPEVPDPGQIDHESLNPVQRGTLTVAFSVTVVALTGVVLNYTPWGITPVSVLIGLDLVVLVAVGISAYCRPFTYGVDVLSDWVIPDRSKSGPRNDLLLNGLLLLSVLLLVGSVGVAITVPNPDSGYSGLHITTETDEGNLTAMEYPRNLTVGEPTELVVGVTNNEFEQTGYTVIVRAQAVNTSGEQTAVTRSRELLRFEPTVAHNETWRQSHEVVPPFAGDRVRIQYLLFVGEPPGEMSPETAYRHAHLWVSVDDGSTT